MEKALYDDVVLFLQDASFSPVHSRGRFIKRNARKYSLYGRRLRQGSRIVLHEEEAINALRSFHLRKELFWGPDFLRAVQETYVVHRAKIFCIEICEVLCK